MPSDMTRDDFIHVLDYHDDLVRQFASGALKFDEFVSLYDNFYESFALDGHESDEAELQLFADLRSRITPHEAIWSTILSQPLASADASARLKGVAATL